MEIRNKQFPYPVLTSYSDDYPNDTFDVHVSCQEEGIRLNLLLQAELSNADLLGLIKNGEAAYTYHIECSATSFRKAWQTSDPTCTISLDSRKISGKVQICPLITAVKDIYGYSSSGFHEDYQGLDFEIEAGCILAAANPVELFVDKANEDFGDSDSIFSIVKNLDQNAFQMDVDYDSSAKIILTIPLDAFNIYSILNKSPENRPVLNSMTIVPALIYVLTEIQSSDSKEEIETAYGEKDWFRQLNKVLKDRFGMEIGDQKFHDANKVVLAQKLAEDPLSEALNQLYSMGSYDLEDDDE